MSLTAVGPGFSVIFPSLGGSGESSSALGTDAVGLGNGQDFGEFEQKEME